MSRLIRDPSDPSEEYREASLPLTNAGVVEHLKACQKLAAEHAHLFFIKFLDAFDETLSDEASIAGSNQAALDLEGLQRAFRQKRSEFERYYTGYVSESFVRFKKGTLNTTLGNENNVEELSLVGNEALEEAIAITSITQRADAYFAEPLWALNQRFAVLNGGEHVTEATNPAAPIQLCEALRKAMKVLPSDNRLKSIAYKVFDKFLLSLTRSITQDVNDYLKRAGILPNLRFTVPTGAAPGSYLSENAEPEYPSHHQADEQADDGHQDAEAYQHQLLFAIRNLQAQLIAQDAAAVPTPAQGVTISESDLLGVLQILQQQNAQTSAQTNETDNLSPLAVDEVAERLRALVAEDKEDEQVSQNDMQTIDLVGMLFDYMLSDENLPDRVKALLSYLHTPFLKIAFIDPEFFEKTDHPARLLLNALAEAGTRWVGNDGSQQYNMYEKIKSVVDRLLKEFDNDVKIITTLLLEFKSYTKNIVRRQELMEKRATEKAQGEEKLREVKMRVNEEIRKRTDARELPSAVLLFLLQPWSDYLSFTLLRYGENSDKWTRALALVDDLLWCIQPKTDEQEKKRQLAMHDDVTHSIKSSFDTIGFDQTKGKKLIDAMVSLMKLAIQSKKAEPAPAPMRQKLEKIAAEKAGEDVLQRGDITPEEAEVVEKLKIIEFGTWFEFESGRRLKVAWYNARTSHYMLVDQMGKRVDMMSGLEMARQMIAGTAKIISGSSKPFFERALENIYQKLNDQAEAAKAKEGEAVV